MNRPLPECPPGSIDLHLQYADAVNTRRRAVLAKQEADRLAGIADQAETVYINALMEFNGQDTLPLD